MGGMEGMDEMGIFTTNIAINNPAANIMQPPAPKAPQSAAPAAPAAAGGMAGMPGMEGMDEKKVKKVHSKRYGVIHLPEPIYPL